MDNKTKSISLMVWGLIILTLVLLALIGFFVWNSQPLVQELNKKELPGCGVVSPDVSVFHTSDRGKTLFKANCSACHTMSEKKGTGPGFYGVEKRIPSRDWLYTFVRNEDSLIKANDLYVMKLRQDYKIGYEHNWTQLTNDEIDAIFAIAYRVPPK